MADGPRGWIVLRRPALLALGALALLALLLRWRSWHNSLFADELSSFSIVTGHSPGDIVRLLNGHSVDLTPPGYFLLAWLSERLGRTPELLRLPALLAGVGTVPLTLMVGERTIGRRAGGAAALLVALGPFMIFYSTEARAYAVVTFLVLSSTLALLSALGDDGRRGDWILYAVLSAAAMYTHYTAVFALGAQLLWALLAHPRRRRPLVAANLAAGALFTPWLPTVVKNTRSPGTDAFSILDPFGPSAVLRDVSHWAIGHPYVRLLDEPGKAALVLIAMGLGSGILLAGWRPGRGSPPRPAAGAILITLLALAMPLGLALYSALEKSTWDARNLICSWPALALAAGGLLTSSRGSVRWIPIGLVAAGFGIGAGEIQRQDHERPDYAAAARIILATGGRHDPVAIVPAPTPGPYAAMDGAMAFAGDGKRPLLRIGSGPLTAILLAPPYVPVAATPIAALAALTANRGAGPGSRVFVVAPGDASAGELLSGAALSPPRILGPVFGTGVTGALLGTVLRPLSDYVMAIAPRFAPERTIELPGFLRLSLYVFRRRRG